MHANRKGNRVNRPETIADGLRVGVQRRVGLSRIGGETHLSRIRRNPVALDLLRSRQTVRLQPAGSVRTAAK